MSIEPGKVASALLAGMAVIGSAYAQTSPGQSAAPQPGADPTADIQSGQLQTVIVNGNRPALNAIPMHATFSESTITPEAILNITPSPATTVQTLLNTQPSIYATTGATNGMGRTSNSARSPTVNSVKPLPACR